jgi:hypothetical protein
MTCPKCKAKVGIMNHEVILDYGIVNGCRCIICGYWKFDHQTKTKTKSRPVALA